MNFYLLSHFMFDELRFTTPIEFAIARMMDQKNLYDYSFKTPCIQFYYVPRDILFSLSSTFSTVRMYIYLLFVLSCHC